MAGIGFRLNKYFSKDQFFNHLKGIIYSIFISSGPWLTTVITIAIISHFAKKNLNTNELNIFRSIICYTYATTLILFGMVEMPLTRYFADKIFINDYTNFKSVFFVIVAFFAITGACLGSLFLHFSPFSLLLKISTLSLFIFIFIIWISMIFLSATKHYTEIVFSFIAGGLCAVIAGPYLGEKMGLVGHLLGLTIGQGFTAAFLTALVLFEYDGPDYFSLDFLTYFKRYYILIFVGLFYYLGIWIDKIIFWFSPFGVHVIGPYYTSPYYDTAFFLAYLTIVPAMAVFIVSVETQFYKNYLHYFSNIEKGSSLNLIENQIYELADSLRSTFSNLFKFQLFFTVAPWYFALEILNFLHLPLIHLTLFRYGVIAAFFQVNFLVINILLLYFKAYIQVLFNYSLFFISNAVLTYITTQMDFRFHGLGIVISSIMTFLSSALIINYRIKKTTYYTFMSQPMSQNNYQETN